MGSSRVSFILIMWAMFRKFLVMLVALFLGLGYAHAQLTTEKPAFAQPKLVDPLPFKVGETLVYDVSFSRLIFSGVIGELKLSVSKPEAPTAPELLEFRADAVSKGFFPALFGIKVKDRFVSLVNQSDFGIHTSKRFLEEGKVRREQTAVVNRDLGTVTYSDRDLASTKSSPKVKEKPSPSWIQDVLSTIYYVRSQALKEGEVIPVPISDAGEVYNIEIVTGRSEEIKTSSGKVRAIPLNAKVFDGRYLKRSGEMLVWVTDDPARVPLRAKIKTSGATITVELKRVMPSS
jgi:Protein of unknown function (DUF3108)